MHCLCEGLYKLAACSCASTCATSTTCSTCSSSLADIGEIRRKGIALSATCMSVIGYRRCAGSCACGINCPYATCAVVQGRLGRCRKQSGSGVYIVCEYVCRRSLVANCVAVTQFGFLRIVGILQMHVVCGFIKKNVFRKKSFIIP